MVIHLSTSSMASGKGLYHNLVEQHVEQQQLMVNDWVSRMVGTLEDIIEEAALIAAKCPERNSTTSMQE